MALSHTLLTIRRAGGSASTRLPSPDKVILDKRVLNTRTKQGSSGLQCWTRVPSFAGEMGSDRKVFCNRVVMELFLEEILCTVMC